MALTDADWGDLIATGEQDTTSLEVETFHEAYRDSESRAMRVTCSDGDQYVIKGTNAGRVPFNEQIVAHLGQLLNAPIPPVAMAHLSTELQEAEPELVLVAPGLVHASRYEPDCSGRTEAIYLDEPDNRQRVAALAVLYTWMRAADRQLIYRKQIPRLVFSVDHGAFFPGGSAWTAETLGRNHPVYELDSFFVAISRKDGILEHIFNMLAEVTPEQIAAAVTRPPWDWGVGLEDRVALCKYLSERQAKVLQLRRS